MCQLPYQELAEPISQQDDVTFTVVISILSMTNLADW